MKRFILFLSFSSFCTNVSFSQTFPNLISHTLDAVPQYFHPEITSRGSAGYRPIPNVDFTHNGGQFRARTYSAPQISQNIRVTCIYVSDQGKWVCIGARFFPKICKEGDDYGIIGPETENILYNFINFSGDKPAIQSEWQKIDDISISGNPKWCSAFLAGREYYYFTILPPRVRPMDAINTMIKIFNNYIDNPSPVKPVINNSPNSVLDKVYIDTIYN